MGHVTALAWLLTCSGIGPAVQARDRRPAALRRQRVQQLGRGLHVDDEDEDGEQQTSDAVCTCANAAFACGVLVSVALCVLGAPATVVALFAMGGLKLTSLLLGLTFSIMLLLAPICITWSAAGAVTEFAELATSNGASLHRSWLGFLAWSSVIALSSGGAAVMLLVAPFLYAPVQDPLLWRVRVLAVVCFTMSGVRTAIAIFAASQVRLALVAVVEARVHMLYERVWRYSLGSDGEDAVSPARQEHRLALQLARARGAQEDVAALLAREHAHRVGDDNGMHLVRPLAFRSLPHTKSSLRRASIMDADAEAHAVGVDDKDADPVPHHPGGAASSHPSDDDVAVPHTHGSAGGDLRRFDARRASTGSAAVAWTAVLEDADRDPTHVMSTSRTSQHTALSSATVGNAGADAVSSAAAIMHAKRHSLPRPPRVFFPGETPKASASTSGGLSTSAAKDVAHGTRAATGTALAHTTAPTAPSGHPAPRPRASVHGRPPTPFGRGDGASSVSMTAAVAAMRAARRLSAMVVARRSSRAGAPRRASLDSAVWSMTTLRAPGAAVPGAGGLRSHMPSTPHAASVVSPASAARAHARSVALTTAGALVGAPGLKSPARSGESGGLPPQLGPASVGSSHADGQPSRVAASGRTRVSTTTTTAQVVTVANAARAEPVNVQEARRALMPTSAADDFIRFSFSGGRPNTPVMPQDHPLAVASSGSPAAVMAAAPATGNTTVAKRIPTRSTRPPSTPTRFAQRNGPAATSAAVALLRSCSGGDGTTDDPALRLLASREQRLRTLASDMEHHERYIIDGFRLASMLLRHFIVVFVPALWLSIVAIISFLFLLPLTSEQLATGVCMVMFMLALLLAFYWMLLTPHMTYADGIAQISSLTSRMLWDAGLAAWVAHQLAYPQAISVAGVAITPSLTGRILWVTFSTLLFLLLRFFAFAGTSNSSGIVL